MKFLLGLSLLASQLLGGSARAAAPDWFSDIEKAVSGCDQNYLCVSGEGSTLNEALGMSRTEAAKFFQTKIESRSQVSLTSGQKGLPSSASVDEWTNKTLSEETSEMLSGLEIKKQEEKDGRFFVVMALDKTTAAREIRESIQRLDQVNAKAFDLNSRFAYPKILKNLTVIDGLLDRHRLLSAHAVPLQIKRDVVLERMNKLKPMKLALMTKGKKLPSPVSHSLIDLLSPLRVVLVPLKSAPKYRLISEVIVEDQYFKVEGFKKVNVNLKIELQNDQKVTLGKISALSEQVARTSGQAMEKAVPGLLEHLQEHLEELTNLKMED